MKFSFPRVEISVKPQSTLGLLVAVDGATVRVELDRSTIQHFMGVGFMNYEAVRDFLWRNRRSIEAAIKAHLFARGVPLDRHVVMSMDDFMRSIWLEVASGTTGVKRVLPIWSGELPRYLQRARARAFPHVRCKR